MWYVTMVLELFLKDQNATGQIDYLETPIIDVANNQDQSFSFALSYAQKSSTQKWCT